MVLAVSFIVAAALTPLMRRLAVRNGIVDWPDLKRKSHVEPVAYLGGVALFGGWLAGVCVSFFLPYQELDAIRFPMTVVAGAAVITLTGLSDDVFGMSPRVKVGGLRLATDLLGSAGWQAPYWVAYILGGVLVMIFVIGGCNSLNLLDGLDGLAAGIAGVASLGFLFLAVWVATQPSTDADLDAVPVRLVMCLALLGTVLGFLLYNFNPATIFMGDAGSLLLGYLCVATILMFADVSTPPNVAPRGPLLVMAAVIVFAVPITDTTLAIVRRKMRGQPIFSPDNQHLHHLFLRFAKKRTDNPNRAVKLAVLALYGLGLMFAVLGCSLIAADLRWRYVLTVFLLMFLGILIVAYRAGHHYAMAQRAAEKGA
jgi:UDP-GlcNAc:undecaprenyl-phosphate GlcNAc-1-phosphate transferase